MPEIVVGELAGHDQSTWQPRPEHAAPSPPPPCVVVDGRVMPASVTTTGAPSGRLPPLGGPQLGSQGSQVPPSGAKFPTRTWMPPPPSVAPPRLCATTVVSPRHG